MKKLLGLRCLAAVAVAAATVGSIAGGFAGTAGAAGTSPPWESTGTNYGSVGGLSLYNASGVLVTGGNLTDAPIAAYVEGASTIRSGDTKATLYAYTPVNGLAPGNWSGQALSASTTYPNASAPSPLITATLPVQTGGSLDESLSEYIAQFPNNDTSSDGYAGIYQLRLKTTASGQGGNTTYDSADIQVSGSTWSLVYPTHFVTTALTTTPASRTAFGSSVGLTATLTPSNATGTVQFKNGTANIGSPVTVSGGTASTTTSSLPVGNDQLYAVFTPDATSGGNGDSASSGNTPFDVQVATTTTLTTSPATQATAGASVQLDAAVSVTPSTSSPATGSVQFEDGTTDIGSPVTVSGGAASTTTTSLPVGSLTLNAVFTATGNYASSSGSTPFTVNPAPVAPSITSAASTTFTVGTAGSFTVTATGSPSPTFSESGSLPAGVTFTGGVLSGTPTVPGTFPITFTASNGVGSPVNQSFTLTVAGFGITTTSLPDALVGTPYSVQLTTAGSPPGATITWKKVALPKGFALSSTGLLTATPSTKATGAQSVQVSVTDAKKGTPVLANFPVTVNWAPAFGKKSPIAAGFTEGQADSVTVTATGSPTPSFTLTGTLPTGVSFDPTTGVLSGTPAITTDSSQDTLTIVASNGIGTPVSETFTLSVYAPLVVTTSPLTIARGATVSGSGFQLANITGTEVGGTLKVKATGLPKSLKLSDTGVLTGTVKSTDTAEDYTVTITASSKDGKTALTTIATVIITVT